MTITPERCLVLAITLFTWLWMDFVGLLLSVLCTYFYFGMEGVPYHFARIVGVVLISVSGALVYRLLLRDRDRSWGIKVMLGSLVLLYFLLAGFRGSDFFAWGVVVGNVVCGMTAVALYRRFHVFAGQDTLFVSVMLGFVVYLATRLGNDGMLTLFRIFSASAFLMFGLLGLVMLGGNPDAMPHSRDQRATPAAQLYAATTGTLIGLCVMFLFNLSLWSSRTPETPAAVYYGSFVLGTFAGIVISRRLAIAATGSFVLSIAASLCIGGGLYVVLFVDYGLVPGLLAHGVACVGTAAFWFLHARRYWASARDRSRALPVFGLIAGTLGFAVPVVFFLLYANPAGYGVALLLASLVTIATEFRARSLEPVAPRSGYRWLVVAALVAVVPIWLSLPSSKGADLAERSGQTGRSEFSVVSTNVRYGWTDDYRFAPREHLQWVKEHPADIIGYQEVNKGSLYGSFTDLLAYYRSAIPGPMVYGDASFGFGNALSTWLPVKDSRVVPFASSDMIQRSFVWTLLEFNGQEIEVFVTHLSHLPHPNAIRQKQVAELTAAISQSQRPWILMGDFNAMPSGPEIAALMEISSPVFARRPELFEELSHPAQDPRKRIDYIFFSDHFELLGQEVIDNGVTSDHRPIRTRLRLNELVYSHGIKQ